jgi:hypothetical protein
MEQQSIMTSELFRQTVKAYSGVEIGRVDVFGVFDITNQEWWNHNLHPTHLEGQSHPQHPNEEIYIVFLDFYPDMRMTLLRSCNIPFTEYFNNNRSKCMFVTAGRKEPTMMEFD